MGGANGSELAGARGQRWSPVKLLRSIDEAGAFVLYPGHGEPADDRASLCRPKHQIASFRPAAVLGTAQLGPPRPL